MAGQAKQEMQNMRLKQEESEQKDRTIEAQAQEIEQLRMANAALLQAAGPVNLSDMKD